MRTVRLSEYEIEAIKETAQEVFGEGTRVWLFGSRTDPSLKGGDIDLYIETKDYSDVVEKKIQFIAKLEERIGEQRIDVIVKPSGSSDTLSQNVKSSGVEL